MKKLLAFATLLTLTAAANADVVVREILVQQSNPQPQNTNIRVNLENTGNTLVKPTNVKLQVRSNDTEAWRTVKTWDDHLTLLAHKKMALDFLPTINQPLDPALTRADFQVRAVVNGKAGQLTNFQRPVTLDTTE